MHRTKAINLNLRNSVKTIFEYLESPTLSNCSHNANASRLIVITMVAHVVRTTFVLVLFCLACNRRAHATIAFKWQFVAGVRAISRESFVAWKLDLFLIICKQIAKNRIYAVRWHHSALKVRFQKFWLWRYRSLCGTMRNLRHQPASQLTHKHICVANSKLPAACSTCWWFRGRACCACALDKTI